MSCLAPRLRHTSKTVFEKSAPPCDFGPSCCEILATGLHSTADLMKNVLPEITVNSHGRPQKFFHGGGQSQHFAYPFQVVDDATQMDVNKMLHPFYATKKRPNVTSTAAYSVFSLEKILH